MTPTSWNECEVSIAGVGSITLMGVSVWPVTAFQWGAVTAPDPSYSGCSVADSTYVKKTSTSPAWIEDTA